ncbi:hypothetical protein LINPERPRIM_LOCUS29569 [Linum perenne]
MARCFPYLPREGFLGDVACGRASIGPIKPHCQTEKIETGNVKKDTEKLLKRKSSRDSKEEETKSKRFKLTKCGGDYRKLKVEEAESSGVTEEHGLPASSRSPSNSSESVKGSNKTTTRDDCKTDNPQERKRKTIRIPLNGSKSKVPVSVEKPCLPSTSSSKPTPVIGHRPRDTVAATSSSKPTPVIGHRPRDIVAATSSSKPTNANEDRPRDAVATTSSSHLTDVREDRPRHPVAAAPETSTSFPDLTKKEKDASAKVSSGSHSKGSRRLNKKMSIYESLTNGWAFPALVAEQSETEDLDWLSTSRKSGRHTSSSKANPNNGAASTCSASLCTTWPKAQCLPEVDVYALPYTIPF